MKMYLLTPEEHAQIVDALNIGIAKHYDLAEDVRIGDVLAMLKEMNPVEPTACKVDTQSGEQPAIGLQIAIRLVLEATPEQLPMAIDALRDFAQPDHSVDVNKLVDPFAVMGISATHRELIAELRKPMHYLSMKRRNQAADALEAIGETK